MTGESINAHELPHFTHDDTLTGEQLVLANQFSDYINHNPTLLQQSLKAYITRSETADFLRANTEEGPQMLSLWDNMIKTGADIEFEYDSGTEDKINNDPYIQETLKNRDRYQRAQSQETAKAETIKIRLRRLEIFMEEVTSNIDELQPPINPSAA